MAGVVIGPCHIADGVGVHEPGEVLDNPSAALLALAEARTLDPESGTPYCQLLSDAKLVAARAAAALADATVAPPPVFVPAPPAAHTEPEKP